jgi:hypothetical protein
MSEGKRVMVVVGFLSLVLMSSAGYAAQIGLNIYGGSGWSNSNGAAVTGIAGAAEFAQANWNNMVYADQPTGSYSGIKDDLGNPTSVQASWAGYPGSVNSGPLPTTQDGYLMKGFLSAGGNTADLTVSNVPYAQYKVVVYFDSDNPWVGYSRVMGFAIGSNVIYGRDNLNFTGTFVQIPGTSSTDQGVSTPAGNYLVFENVSGSSFTLTATPGSVEFVNDSPMVAISGLQIVSVPEPATVVVLVALAGINLLRKKQIVS